MTTVSETALAKPEVYYESKKIRLTSRMLHIGSETQKLSPFEYVATGKFVYFPDTDALAKALNAKKYLERYIQCIERREEIIDLLEDALGDNWEQAKSPDGRIIFPKHRRSLRQTDQPIRDLRPMIRNGMGQLYIPGSSIKGAIRTAIAYHLLKYADRYRLPEQQRSSAIEENIRQKMGEIRGKARSVNDQIFMDRLFTDFRLEGDRTHANMSPNTDFMRTIRVADGNPLIEKERFNKQGRSIHINQPMISEVMLISHTRDWKTKYKPPLYTELVRTVKTSFEITLDKALLAKFSPKMRLPFQSIKEILDICQEFAQDQWHHERTHWLHKMKGNPNAQDSYGEPINLSLMSIQNFYQSEICPYSLRLGWASGMLGTTMGLMFSEELRQELRAVLYPRNPAPGFESPKSRRVVANRDREIIAPLGWVKFEELP